MDKSSAVSAAGWQTRGWTYATALPVAAAFLFCYAGVFKALAGVWWNNSVYSHGFVVPFISAYIIWMERDRLKAIKPTPRYPAGLTVLSAGLFMLAAGTAASVMVVQELSIIVTLAGVTLTVLGWGFLRALSFPIAYLLLMLRFWEFIMNMLHYPFQNFSAFMGTKLLNLAGIPAYREAVYIELPNITLEVAQVCSGVNYLISVLALGIPLAYLTMKTLPRRIALVSFGILIAILANGLRVALIGTLAYYNLSGDLHGPFHALQALFVAIVGFMALFIGAWALSRWPVKNAGPEPDRAQAARRPAVFSKGGVKNAAIASACVMLIAGSYVNLYRPSPVPLKKALGTFPYIIGKWKGFDAPHERNIFAGRGETEEIWRTYARDGRELNLYIGYYDRQEQGAELVNYKTAELDSGGEKLRISLGNGQAIEVKKRVSGAAGKSNVTVFWYDLNGRTVTDRYAAKAYTAYDALFKWRTNGAVIIISAESSHPRDSEEMLKEEADFARDIVPHLRDYLP